MHRPDDFPTENEWQARETIERSNALKCPSLADHLTGEDIVIGKR